MEGRKRVGEVVVEEEEEREKGAVVVVEMEMSGWYNRQTDTNRRLQERERDMFPW